jgi:DNA-binding response OmpR family regulator
MHFAEGHGMLSPSMRAMTDRILIIDDDTRAATALGYMLDADGYQVTISTDGKLALDDLRAQHFDVILTDLEMPGVGGIQFLRDSLELRQNTVVYVITAYASWQNEKLLTTLGVRKQFTKPLEYDRLLEELATLHTAAAP